MIPRVRCAIYTRKSSEDGLEQDFNSLDAQREACEAYITSQKAEGWVLIPDRFDDGGLSGGTLERPALQALLAAIEAGHIDQVVVYKIDRLTRSLADFAKIVDRLDAMQATFVSVTQSFNTATSMGRLTLNMLLSFAQFEREVTAERIRDKISASKKKGLWMGGTVPLGYAPNGRTLLIDETHAPIVRTLFDLYLKHQSLRQVQIEAEALDLRTRAQSTSRGTGNVPFAKGHIHAILSNPVYAGRIRHHKAVYPGQHPPLIDPEIWDRVQDLLQQDAARARGIAVTAPPAPLLGKLFDDTGDALTPTHTTKAGKRMTYYISRRLVGGLASDHPDAWRLPAPALEQIIAEALYDHLTSETAVATLLPEISAADLKRLQSRFNEALKPLQTATGRNSLLTSLLDRVDLAPSRIALHLSAEGLSGILQVSIKELDADVLTVTRPLTLKRRGNETRLVLGSVPTSIDTTLLANIRKARSWYTQIKAGSSFAEIAAAEGHQRCRVQHMIGLAFLAPDILENISNGAQPLGFTSEWVKRHELPVRWQDQRDLLSRL